MLKISLFQASIQSLMLRFYLMLFIVLLGLMFQTIWTLFIGIPIFLYGLLGIKVIRQ